MGAKQLIKLLISLGMLALVLNWVDLPALQRTLLGIPLWDLMICIAIYMFGQVMSSYKWYRIAIAGKINVPYSVALKAYFIGMYVNCFGLGTLGGDFTRGVLIANGQPLKTEGVASVIADRASGLLILALIGIVSILVISPDGLPPMYDYGLFALTAAIVVGWFFGPRILLAIVPKNNRFRGKIEGISSAFPKDPWQLMFIALLSLGLHFAQLSIHKVMAGAVGVDLSWAQILVAIPFVNILSSLPISWQGLGVRETSYVFFLGSVLSSEQAVAFGTIWLVSSTVSSAVGGIVSVLTGDLKLLKKQRLSEART